MSTVIVTGATSQIGSYLLESLSESGFTVHAASRNPVSSHGVFWHETDIEKEGMPLVKDADTLIHLAPIWLLPNLLASLSGIRRIIAFSSTSRFTKEKSKNPHERALAERLADAESRVIETCDEKGMAWTILRPTIIYSPGRDRNLTRISGFIAKFGFFPLAGKGTGLRQPVHAADLADACIKVLGNERACGKSYNLSGGETLTYREMIARIFRGLKRKPRFVSIPLPVLRTLLAALAMLPRYKNYTAEMADRMNRDLCFDHSDAVADFAYSPRPFSWQPPEKPGR